MDKNLFRYEGSKTNTLLISILTIGQSVLIILQAYYLSLAIAKLFEGQAVSAVLPFLFYFGLFVLLRYSVQWLKDRMSYRFAERTAKKLQSDLIEKLFTLDSHEVNKFGSGSLVALSLEGIKNFRTYVELFIPRAISMMFIPLIILIFVFMKDVLSGIVLLLTMPILIAFLILIGLLTQKKIGTQMKTYHMLSRHFVDSLRGLVTLKYLGRSKSHEKAIGSVSEKHRKATMKTLQLAFLSSFALDFFSSLSVAVVAVELGLRLIDGNIGLQTALLILILAPEYFLPVRSFGTDYHATMDGKKSGEQIHKLLENASMSEREKQPLEQWGSNSTLKVENVTKYGEDGSSERLRQLSFTVKGYQKIGVVGHSGSGKSTLINVLAGLLSMDEGKVCYNGQELSSFQEKDWLKQITYIPQHPYIFSGTLEDNIRWYKPDASYEEVNRAAEKAGLTELVNKLPNGFTEKIGQGGRSLSGGEEQRIALARTLLADRPIIFLDEPTAHLDIETEHEIKKVMLPILENKLVLLATHRLHWMKQMDIIFVLDKGSLVEIGTHKELVERKGKYFELIQVQNGGGKDA